MHRRNQREFIENLRAANIAGMQYQFDAGQRSMHIRPDESMRVADKTNQHAVEESLAPQRGTNDCSTPS